MAKVKKGSDNLVFGLLPNGGYLYSFCIDDIFGGSYITDAVSFYVDGFSVIYDEAFSSAYDEAFNIEYDAA